MLSKGFCVGFDGDSVPVVNDSVLSRNSLDLKKTVAEYWYFLKPCPEKNTSDVNGTAHCKIAAHASRIFWSIISVAQSLERNKWYLRIYEENLQYQKDT